MAELNQLANVTTADGYDETGGATISNPQTAEPFVAVEIEVTGAAVFYRVEEAPGRWSPDETFSGPRVGVLALGTAYGIKFRSAVAGAPAQVSARMVTRSQVDAAGGLGAFAAPGFSVDASGAVRQGNVIANLQSLLGADVAIANPNVYIDAATLQIPAGTWLVIGRAVAVRNVAGGFAMQAKLWDGGANVYGSSEAAWGSSPGALVVAAVVVLAAQTIVKCSVATSVGNCSIKAAILDNPAGNTATALQAIQLA